MKKILIGLLVLTSASAQAGLVCNVKTLKNNKTISDLMISEAHGYMGAGHILDIVTEKDTRKESITISIAGRTSGWRGQEFLEAVIYRKEFKKGQYNRSTELTEVFKLGPGNQIDLSYEDYLTTISCERDDRF